MEIGTADILSELKEPKERRAGLTLGDAGPGNGGGGRGPGGPGGDDDRDETQNVINEPFIANKSRILTLFLLLAVLMTFGGLIAAYVVIFTNNVAEWQPFALPIQVWVSTAIIVASSITYHLGKNAIIRNEHPGAKKWLVATTVLGAAFVSSQMLAWMALANRGFYLRGNPYAGFFYILTAIHAVHVLGGIAALGSVLLRSWNPTTRPESVAKRSAIAEVVGWYWHCMGALWLVLFVLLGFWK